MPSEQDQLASLDALLALAKKEGRGIKVFLGNRPGVGKAYAILASSRAAKTECRDVETEALLEGLEIFASKPTVCCDLIVNDSDLDAALAWHPKLLPANEYAPARLRISETNLALI